MMRRSAWCCAAALSLIIGFSCNAFAASGNDGSNAAQPGELEAACAPAGSAKAPAVLILHDATPAGTGAGYLKKLCYDLASHGYFAKVVEYYGGGKGVVPTQKRVIKKDSATWLHNLDAAVVALKKEPRADGNKVGLIGFGMGASLALTEGMSNPTEIRAIVDYYGGLMPESRKYMKDLPALSRQFPPTLILQGDADSIVPVAATKELDMLLNASSLPHQFQVYEGAEHAFDFPETLWSYNADDAQDAWNRTLQFLDKHLK